VKPLDPGVYDQPDARRAGAANSANRTMPTMAVLAAPMPVQMA
jgi:hypothetical protein